MSISLASISRGKALKAPRIILVGVEKVGKSSWAAGCPGTIFVPMKGERGIDELDVAKFPAVETFDQLNETFKVLYSDPHDFSMVAIDSASALEPIIWDQACKDNNAASVEKIGGGFGKWKNETLKYWRQVTEALDALRDERNMGSIVIGHVKTKEINDPEVDPYTAYLWDLSDSAANLLYRWADCILFANFQKAVTEKIDKGFNQKIVHARGTGKRVLYTEKRPAHPGGNRFSLPYELDLNWAAFAGAMEKARSPQPTP
jgi:hypothetical protein